MVNDTNAASNRLSDHAVLNSHEHGQYILHAFHGIESCARRLSTECSIRSLHPSSSLFAAAKGLLGAPQHEHAINMRAFHLFRLPRPMRIVHLLSTSVLGYLGVA